MEGTKMLKAIVAITMAAMLFESVSARNITVGGSTGWDLNTNLTQWSYSTPIFVNDSLLFVYTPAHDVIEVSESDFSICERTRPIGAYNNADGVTLIPLPQPGPRYFICGRLDHCFVGLKVRVQVLDRPQSQPNASSPNYPANQPNNNRTNSDEPAKDLPPNSSAGQKAAIARDFAQLILLICLYDATFATGFASLYWFMLRAGIYFFFCVLMDVYKYWFRAG
ncbi:uclacyanin 1-like [Silene latifolia]|uniref:uclacyanin 1-like n=1 Tax=Silene latifolia TaxID=37657 RepID=UPI003D76E44C